MRSLSKGTELQLYRMNKSRVLIYGMLTVIHNTLLDTRNLLRVDLDAFVTHKQMVTVEMICELAYL